MKQKREFIVRTIVGENVLVPVGSVNNKFSGLISLNDSALFLWNALPEAEDEDALIRALCEEYEVDETAAETDVAEFLATLRENGII